MALAEGVRKQQALQEAGFTGEELAQWREETARTLNESGFSAEEVNQYFGEKPAPAMTGMKALVNENLARAPAGDKKPMKEANDFLSSLEAGFDISVSGLLKEAPDTVLPENAPMFYRIASQVGTLAGDVPAMLAGGVAGGALGGTAGTATVPVLGTVSGAVVGAGAGAFALPAGMRQVLMDHYEKGDVKDFQDFWERTSAATYESFKGAVTGAATAVTGGAVGSALAPIGSLTAGVGTAAAEIATMTTVGKALEGQAPQPQDFLEGAILVGGLKGVGHVAPKLRKIYAKTGDKPAEVALDTRQDLVLNQELASSNIEIPSKFGGDTPKGKVLESPANESFVSDPDIPDAVDVQPYEAPMPKEVKPKELSPETQDVLKRIGEQPKPGKKTELLSTFDQNYMKFVDELHPLKVFSETLAQGKKVPASQDPYTLARLSKGSFGRADQFLSQSTFSFGDLKNTGKGFKQVLKPVEGRLDEFRAYAISKRALELDARAVESGVDVNSARAVVSQYDSEFKSVFKELQTYQNATVDYLAESGILSKEAVASIKEANKNYIPFYRVFEEGSSGKGPGKGLNVKNPIKEIKGSERLLVDPIESIIKNTYAYVQLAERNRVVNSVVSMWEKSGKPASLMQRLVSDSVNRMESPEAAKFFEEHGIDPAAQEFLAFKKAGVPSGKGEISVFRNGKRETYQTDPFVAEALTSLDTKSAGMLVKVLSYPAKTLRAGVTLVPEFAAKNFMRDQMTAINLSKSGFFPIADSLRGLGSLLKKDEAYQTWLKAGGANSAMVSIDRAYIQENIFKLNEETGFMDKTWNVVKSPLHFARVTSELIENSTRLGEFKNAMKKGKDPYAAAFESREVTLDFARIGSQVRAMNMITAFWNVGIQGVDRTARAFKENPMGASARMAASITVPSVLLWYANHDDPRWKDIPRWQKDLFWIVMTKDNIYRIPKPFEMGIAFGSLPERTLEAYFTDNPKAYDDFMSTVGSGLTPSFVPTAAIPIVEHFANKSTLTGAPIVSSSVEKILPEYQFTEYTSETAKILGKMVSSLPNAREATISSPAVLENYIRGWTGGTGQYALKVIDQALYKSGIVPEPVRPADTLADIPFVKAFVIRNPSAGTQNIVDFHERYNSNLKQIDTIKYLAKQGDFDNVLKEMQIGQQNAKLVDLKGITQALGVQSRFVRMVYKDPKMTKYDKRQLIDQTYRVMNQAAIAGNKIMDDLEKELKKKPLGQ